ncbi:carbonic anhydrase [Salicibibacter halophilus]|uniref:carbonic anhydrase n=1 Tax=Salicibibacter halophilus TaxID=2502791 RepID=A0A514LJT3_9BACI|nr:carbonic anhydrase [Salicibibacter halophilus]QDI92082.1 carbonic anhydrase [Salicibibacter halophilus]
MYLDDILAHNKQFVGSNQYEPYKTSNLPNQKSVILTCMDTRLIELLPAALNIKNGDVKMVKNAGGMITSPYDSVVRSIFIAINALQAEEVLIIGHKNCGMQQLDPSIVMEKMRERNIEDQHFQAVQDEGVDINEWLAGFETVEQSVANSVEILTGHPLMPASIPIHGLVIDPETGELTLVTRGYEQ